MRPSAFNYMQEACVEENFVGKFLLTSSEEGGRGRTYVRSYLFNVERKHRLFKFEEKKGVEEVRYIFCKYMQC